MMASLGGSFPIMPDASDTLHHRRSSDLPTIFRTEVTPQESSSVEDEIIVRIIAYDTRGIVDAVKVNLL